MPSPKAGHGKAESRPLVRRSAQRPHFFFRLGELGAAQIGDHDQDEQTENRNGGADHEGWTARTLGMAARMKASSGPMSARPCPSRRCRPKFLRNAAGVEAFAIRASRGPVRIPLPSRSMVTAVAMPAKPPLNSNMSLETADVV